MHRLPPAANSRQGSAPRRWTAAAPLLGVTQNVCARSAGSMRWRAGPGPFLTVLTGPPAGGGVDCGSSVAGSQAVARRNPTGEGISATRFTHIKAPKQAKRTYGCRNQERVFPWWQEIGGARRLLAAYNVCFLDLGDGDMSVFV